ncbi:14966_t:CDS:1, partial [Acaulospora colombiana]
ISVEQVSQGEVNIDVKLKLDNFTSPQKTQIAHVQPSPEKLKFKGSSRPLDGYLLNISRVNDYCEPKSYEKEAFKEYRIQSCLDFLSQNESEYMYKPKNSSFTYKGDPMIFHVYWRGKLTDKISLMIKSFLYTQPLDSSVLNVWMDSNDEDLSENSYILPLLKFSPQFIQFRKWNVTEQLSYDPIYKGWEKSMKKHHGKITTVGYSDMVRFVLLNRYGGLYVDADVLLLRDMRPLYHLNYEWSYRWSEWFDYNTAVLRIWKNSTTSRTIIAAAMKNKMNFHPTIIKNYLAKKKKKISKSDINGKLYMMSVTMFDPLWLKSDLLLKDQVMVPNLCRFKDVFKGELLKDEFPG